MSCKYFVILLTGASCFHLHSIDYFVPRVAIESSCFISFVHCHQHAQLSPNTAPNIIERIQSDLARWIFEGISSIYGIIKGKYINKFLLTLELNK